jgi:hypothetical protein
MATIRYRRNAISTLTRDDGSEAVEHHEKAGILWSSFRDRLGISIPIDDSFDFSHYLTPCDDLEDLSAPLTNDEIDQIVAHLPTDKAPGPDGFTGMFIKICWPIIKYDFYKLCHDFWDGNVNLQSINDSFITLVPKVHAPRSANDYRPISLLNSCLKLLTKILANRLQNKILKMIHTNQYGFLRSRSIQDCLGWAYEYIHQTKQSGTPSIILKLDFAKAFDTMEHKAILKILACKGLDERWIAMVDAILATGTSSILLNGVPGKKFPCKRGVQEISLQAWCSSR